MADVRLSNNIVNIEADAAKVRFNNGYCRIYSSPRPATADDAATGTQLAELRFAATAYASQVNGLITMNALTSDSDADATGTAAWYRALESDGVTVIADGDCTVSGGGGAMQMASLSIVQHQTVSCSSFTHTVPKS